MTSEQMTLSLIQNAVKEMPAESQEAVREMAEHFRIIVKQAANGDGAMALALVGAEMAAEN